MVVRDKTKRWCMNCHWVHDMEIEDHPEWQTLTDEQGQARPVRDFYGTIEPICRRYPVHGAAVRVQPDGWCAEWRPADDFEEATS